MNKPDNFSAAAFRRAHGDDAYVNASEEADVIAFSDGVRAKALKTTLCAVIRDFERYEFETIFPAPGYEMEDLLGMMRDIRDKINLTTYAQKAREIALDKELNR